ncbi:MAG TPA: hypothetical protein PK156_35730 [Polyangium sp.]|nr:hypothetical protein [Polyangium sp.]
MASDYWPSFRERVEELGHLPKFVVREVDEYLRGGLNMGLSEYVIRFADSSDWLDFRASTAVFARPVWAGA